MVTDTSPVVDTQDDEAFRASVREFIAANYPPGLPWHDIAFASVEGPTVETPGMTAWRKAVGERGWGTPTWPAEYGGGGLSRERARILQQEFERAGVYNPIGGMGVMMFGPTLLEYGTEEQKKKHIPPICRGEIRWCQGYSEPNAGSDLASLQTWAENKGDHYVVNGQKTWTSGGQWADWCFALVRTDRSKKQGGISFLLIDMTSPGVDRKPIRMISGLSPFCETFFTDVVVPKENLVGEEGQGWTIGKRLLQHERTNLAAGGESTALRASNFVGKAKAARGLDSEGRLSDPDLRARIAKFEIEWAAFELTAQRAVAESKSGGVSTIGSILKKVGTKLNQERAELAIEIAGRQGLGWEGDNFSEEELEDTRAWLFDKASTIYGGSTEVQNNIIAKNILGMLEHQ